MVKKVLPELQDAIRIKINLLSSIMMTSPNHLQLNFTSGANISKQIALELASKDFTQSTDIQTQSLDYMNSFNKVIEHFKETTVI